MWSPNRFARLLLVLALPLAAGACGFQPVYAPADAAPSGWSGQGQATDARELARRVEIAPIEDRFGQIMRGLLRERLQPTGPVTPPLYRLSVEYDTATQDLGVRKNDLATRANLSGTARVLFQSIGERGRGDTGRNADVHNSWALRATASYDIVDNPYASQIAERDASRRVAISLAERIAARVRIALRDDVLGRDPSGRVAR